MAPPAQLAPAQLEREVPAPRSAVLSAAVRVLTEHGATVGATDRIAGVVQSQPFTVEERWDDVYLTDRIDCGKDMAGVEKAMMNPVTLTLGVLADSTAAGTRVRLKISGSTYDQVARAMASTNVAAAASSGGTPCTLKPAFVQQLLEEIASTAGGAPG